MTIKNEKHYCLCPPEIVHVGGHWRDCCSCIRCSHCNRWVQTRFWPAHSAPGGCAHRSGQIPRLTENELAPPSLELALSELGDLGACSKEFQEGVRQCIGELIDYFGNNSGTWFDPPNRTAAWKKVMSIFLSPKDDEDRLQALLQLFEETERTDELEAHLLFLIIMMDRNNPNPLGL